MALPDRKSDAHVHLLPALSSRPQVGGIVGFPSADPPS